MVTNDNGSVNMAKLRHLEKKHGVAPLERIDHDKIVYRPFTKNFYAESSGVEPMTNEQVDELRRAKRIFVKGELVAKPLARFDDLRSEVVDQRIFQRLSTKQGI